MTDNSDYDQADSNVVPEQEFKYRAELDAYSGPLDLLLYLIKRDEVDVFDIPVSQITEQYLAVVEAMEFLDINVAGDFLVMAATLMEMKSRMLLPAGSEESSGEEPEDDPRNDLIRQLLQYKRFKEAAQELEMQAREQALRVARPAQDIETEPEPVDEAKLLEGVQVWDLLAAFSALMRQTQLDLTQEIIYDDVPLSVFLSEVRTTLAHSGGRMEFMNFFSPGDSKIRLIGIFVALLELTKLGEIRVRQLGSRFGEILIELIPQEQRISGKDYEAQQYDLREGDAETGVRKEAHADQQDDSDTTIDFAQG